MPCVLVVMGEAGSPEVRPALRIAAVLDDRSQGERLTALLADDRDLEHFLAHLLRPLPSRDRTRFARLILAREGTVGDRVLATLDQLAGLEHSVTEVLP